MAQRRVWEITVTQETPTGQRNYSFHCVAGTLEEAAAMAESSEKRKAKGFVTGIRFLFWVEVE